MGHVFFCRFLVKKRRVKVSSLAKRVFFCEKDSITVSLKNRHLSHFGVAFSDIGLSFFQVCVVDISPGGVFFCLSAENNSTRRRLFLATHVPGMFGPLVGVFESFLSESIVFFVISAVFALQRHVLFLNAPVPSMSGAMCVVSEGCLSDSGVSFSRVCDHTFTVIVFHCRTRRLAKTTPVRSARHMQTWGQKETIWTNQEIRKK